MDLFKRLFIPCEIFWIGFIKNLDTFLRKEFVQQETIRRLEIQLSLSDSQHWLFKLHQQVNRDKQPAYPPKGFFSIATSYIAIGRKSSILHCLVSKPFL